MSTPATPPPPPDDPGFHQDPATGRILDRRGNEYQLYAVDEVGRLREDAATACRMLAKARWRGPWTLTPAEWAALGRRMAGLKPEAPAETSTSTSTSTPLREPAS